MPMPEIEFDPANDVDQRHLDVLIDLHTRSLDTLEGFEKMVDKAVTSFRPTAERFRALHENHVIQLEGMVRDCGGIPDDDGSFMATVNRAVVSLRATFDDIDTDVMVQIRSGEDNLLAAFDRALAAPLPNPDQQSVTRMRAELAGLLDDTRHIN